MPVICIFEDCQGHKLNLRTARKKGTVTLAGGKKQQVWHCRECGKTWQTDDRGNVIDSRHLKKKKEACQTTAEEPLSSP